jgi:uncharacterized membrane protein
MKKKTILFIILGASVALLVTSHIIRGSISSPPSLLIPLMLGQLVGTNLIPLAVGGFAWIFKKKPETFFWGWLVTFVLFGIGFLYQSSLERGRNLFE